MIRGALRRLLGHPPSAAQMLDRAWRLGAAARGGPALSILPEGADWRAAPAEWIGFLAPQDRLAPHAAAAISAALAGRPDARLLFTDTAIARPGGPDPWLKPGFDPLMQEETGYAGRIAVFRRDLLDATGWRGSEAATVSAAARGLDAGALLHLPYPAVIGPERAWPASPALPAPRPMPRVSVIIPSRDRPVLIATVLRGLLEDTDTRGVPPEILVVDNGSTDPEVAALYARLRGRIRVLRHDAPFNFSAMVNHGLEAATGEALLLLNNDIEVTSPDWLAEMCACLARPGTGIVGPKLLFPDGTLQHAGVVTGLGAGHAGHPDAGSPGAALGPMGRLTHRRRLSAVTGAAMLISRACLEATGPFDAARFGIAYNDVDFCLRARALGFGVTWTPHAVLTHHESATRRRRTGAALRQFRAEKAALRALHATGTAEDPAFSPWYARRLRPELRALAALPPPRAFMPGDA
ncbi:glycosyltransferase family 2 protein [Paroceanicella profunda]|uniref:Glycosyltransferase family 2 protein n=1 Tax=Paroceanicella profunda TaxID=2579971 RepID=A0A5B8FS86_9RHOB|nr:glycosyltransferase family 2 protein [Paroceanicella profunda]QDL91225.1 glycosyltransferase family 2 protein [Paroceanicella profunda]